MKTLSETHDSRPRAKNDWDVCMFRHGLADLSKLPDKVKKLTAAHKRVLGHLYEMKRQSKTRISVARLGTQWRSAAVLESHGMIKLCGSNRQFAELTQKGEQSYELIYWVEVFEAERRRKLRGMNTSPEYNLYVLYLEQQAAHRMSHRKMIEHNKDGAPKTGDRNYDMYMMRLPKSLRGTIFQSGIDPKTVYQEYCKHGREYIDELYGAPVEGQDKRIREGCLVSITQDGCPLEVVVDRVDKNGTIYFHGGYAPRSPDKVKFKAPPLD